MSVSSTKSSRTGRSLTKHASVFVLALALVVILINPFPSQLNSLEARVEYTKQVVLHVLGFLPTYDLDALNAAYARQANEERKNATTAFEERRNVTAPSFGKNLNQPFQLSKLPELDAVNDPDWHSKFQRIFNQEEKPVVVRGLMYARPDIYPMAKQWNIEYLKEKVYGNAKVPVFTNTTYDKSAVLMPFTEYVDGLKDKTKVRYARCLDDMNHTMRKGFSMEKLTRLMGKYKENEMTRIVNGDYGCCLFVGSDHVSTRMHSDVGTSAFSMIQGRKRWILFPPSESMYFLPVGHLFNVAYNSLLDVFAKDILEKHPFAALAKGWEVVIEPGDVLFFPSFTWHAVENLDELTIGMDLAVYDVLGSMRRQPLLAMGTVFNFKIWYRVIVGLLQGKVGSMKATFFEGYLKDEVRQQEKQDNNGAQGQYFHD